MLDFNTIFFKLKMFKNKFIYGKKCSIEGSVNINTKYISGGYLKIGNGVTIRNDVELRIKDNSSIIIGDNVVIDNGVRLLSAQNGKLIIGDGTKIGKNSIFNAGEDIIIGNNCLISGNVSINSSTHSFKIKNSLYKNQYKHKKIQIGQNVWLGANVIILPGVSVGEDSVIDANLIINFNVDKLNIIKNKQQIDKSEIKKV
jgi:maltose O-acetyltransferase